MNSKCKSLDVGVCLAFERHHKAREAGMGCSKKIW